MDIRIGCSGFSKGMKEYFSEFDIVELQSTFYQLPSIKTAERWLSLSPPDFEFTVKAWQGITHPVKSPTYKRFKGILKRAENYGYFKQTEEVMEAWKNTETICRILRAKYVLFQCPASFKPTDENIENIIIFFSKIEREDFHFVWEPRGKEWTDDIIFEICNKCNLIHCVDPFSREPITRDIAYFRLHGSPPGEKMYYYSYTDKDLDRLLEICRGFKQAYCFFNNFDMHRNALRFKEIITQ